MRFAAENEDVVIRRFSNGFRVMAGCNQLATVARNFDQCSGELSNDVFQRLKEITTTPTRSPARQTALNRQFFSP